MSIQMAAGAAMAAGSGGVNFGALVAPNLNGNAGIGDDGSVDYQIRSNGDEWTETFTPLNQTVEGQWIGNGVNSDYEAMLSVTSGDGPDAGATTDVWHVLSTTRSWSQNGAGGAFSGTWRIQIRRVSDNFVGLDQSFTVDTAPQP